MNKRIVALLTGALLATALIAGCSGGGPQGDEAAIQKTVADFAKAFSDGKAQDLINLLDAESSKDCDVAEIASVLALIKSFGGDSSFSAEISDIKVDGDNATGLITASLAGEKQTPEEQKLVKEGGKWKLAFGSEGCGF